MRSQNSKAWLGVVVLAVVMGLLLFLSAGTVRYWQAWAYLFVFFAGALCNTLYLMRHDRALLERRLRAGPMAEKQATQKFIMLFASLGFVALLVVSALDFRFGWSVVAFYVVALGNVLVAAGHFITFLVYKENTYSAATVQIVDAQKVVSTGPYALVRHPMYAGGLLYCLGTPLALGSYWGLLALAAMLGILIWRLLDEEAFLAEHLAGYGEYLRRVRWRLIPLIF